MPTYLQRADQPVDALHGPFPGPVVFGSDASRCQMVLDEPGISPVHAILGPLDGGQFTLAPEGPDCALFLRRPGRDQLWPVDCPVSAKVGATIVFGSPEGPAFVISVGDPGSPRPATRNRTERDIGPLERALEGSWPAPRLDEPDTEVAPRAPDFGVTQVVAPELGPVSGAPRTLDWLRGAEPSVLMGCGAAAFLGFLIGAVVCAGTLTVALDALGWWG